MMPLEQCRPLNGGRLECGRFLSFGAPLPLLQLDGSRSAGTTSPEAGLGRVRRFATPPALPLHHLARNYLLVRRCASLTYFALILSFVRLSHSRASRQQKSRQRIAAVAR